MTTFDQQQAACEWMLQAACAGMDGNLFFPEKGDSVAEALEVCAGCPVRAECLEYVLAMPYVGHGGPPGIWGGTTGRERRQIKASRNRGRRAL